MPKNIEDVIPSDKSPKKTIRNIPVPDRRRAVGPIDGVAPKNQANVERRKPAEQPVLPRVSVTGREPARTKRSKGRPRKTMWIAAVAAFVFVAATSFSLIGGASITYTPYSADLSFDNDIYAAYKRDRGDELLFSVVKLSGSKATEISATGEEQVHRKASGKIVVYNESLTAQRLIKNTRFESSDGKIYRVDHDISIPAGKNSGGSIQPGTLEITVYADAAGESYNIGLSDFTIPGLKGDSRFETIYARSKIPMTGGFSGIAKVANESELSKANSELMAALRDDLLREARAQAPAEFVLYPELSIIEFNEPVQTNAGNGNVTVSQTGNFYGVMFKRSDLAAFLATEKTNTELPLPVRIADIDSLSLSFNGEQPANLLDAEEISFVVTGTAKALSHINEESLRQSVAGKDKDELQSILRSLPGIKTADAVVRPFWKSAFPEEASKIKISENY